MKPALVLFSLVLALTGCAGAHSHAKAAAIDEAAFAGMWNLYQHCRASADPVLIWLDAERLSRAAVATQDLPPSLPRPFDRYVSRPPLRLATDPKALAAHCALHGAQVALDDGRPDLATELFLLIMQRHPESEYTYYVDQARVGLAQLVSAAASALKPIPVSSPGR